MSGYQDRVATAEWTREAPQRLAWPVAVAVIAALSLGCWLTIGLLAKLLFG